MYQLTQTLISLCDYGFISMQEGCVSEPKHNNFAQADTDPRYEWISGRVQRAGVT